MKHAPWSLWAESPLTRRLFGATLRWNGRLPVPAGSSELVGEDSLATQGRSDGGSSTEPVGRAGVLGPWVLWKGRNWSLGRNGHVQEKKVRLGSSKSGRLVYTVKKLGSRVEIPA